MSGHRRRPFFGRVVIQPWTKPGEPDIPGIALIGLGGLSAHLAPAEALDLADQLHGLAEQLEVNYSLDSLKTNNTEGNE